MKKTITLFILVFTYLGLFAQIPILDVIEIPIFKAVKDGNVSEIERQISQGSNINTKVLAAMGNGMFFEITPLQLALLTAIENQNFILCARLIELGADINISLFQRVPGIDDSNSTIFDHIITNYASQKKVPRNFVFYAVSLNPVNLNAKAGIFGVTLDYELCEYMLEKFSASKELRTKILYDMLFGTCLKELYDPNIPIKNKRIQFEQIQFFGLLVNAYMEYLDSNFQNYLEKLIEICKQTYEPHDNRETLITLMEQFVSIDKIRNP